MSQTPHSVEPFEPLKVGDHPALDFLNTTVMEEGVVVDRLQNDADVLHWLNVMGFDRPQTLATANGALLRTARSIREALRASIETAKAGRAIDWQHWNELLAKSPSHAVVTAHDGHVDTRRVWAHNTPEEVLGGLLESVVDLLVTGDFNLIRQCEDHTCILWFYDRTKSHRRRWCSMSMCGNRNKVAAFRERQKA